MLRTLALGSLAALCLSGAAFADDNPVSSVQVNMDISAITNPKAAAYWTTISDDLENAIVARLVGRQADADANPIELEIDLNEVSLSGALSETLGLEDTRLVGDVKTRTPAENNRIETYQLTVDVNAARVFIPAGVDLVALTPDSPIYYKAMIDAFAEAVVERLD